MGLETGTFINDLVITNPLGTDDRSTADDHLRLLKTLIRNTIVKGTAAINPTPAECNLLVGLLTSTAELNKLNGVTATTAEINFLVGVLGAIIDTNGGQTIADLIITNALTLNGELIMNAGYSEDSNSYTVTTGTKGLDTSAATVFYPAAPMTAVAVDFTFDNPAASGRVTSFILELENMIANTDATPWPTSVDWANGIEPAWSAGIDIVTFWTRDNGTIWHGSQASQDSS